MATATKSHLLTPNFVLVALTWLLLFGGYYLLISTLPVYVVRQIGGHEPEIGLVMGLPTLTTVLLLPVFGRMADSCGRKVVLLAGLLGIIGAGVLYYFATALFPLLVLRLFFGAVWAAAVSGLITVAADVSPVARRAEALGYFNIAANIALATFPTIGLEIIRLYDFRALFAAYIAIGFIALASGLALPETLQKSEQTEQSTISQNYSQASVRVFLSPIVMFCVTVAYGALLAFLPLYASSRGVENAGMFFSVLATFIIISRLFAGRISDRLGRRAVIVPGTILATISLLVLATAVTLPAIIAVGALFGVGFGSAHSALMALAADGVSVDRRGIAMGYFAASIELGIGIGAIVMGVLVGFVGYPGMYAGAAAVALLGLMAYLLLDKRTSGIPDSQLRSY